MPQKGNTDNGILRVAHFEPKLNIPPIYFSSLYIHHLTGCPPGTPYFSRTAYLSKPTPLVFLNITSTDRARTSTSLSPSNSISVRMAQPSSSHRDRDREGHSHRSERSTHRHHRTISSTTLLLVLSLILAVLAVMLSLPNQSSSGSTPGDPAGQGVWSVLTPKRSQALIARERDIALREAEVARREAEILAGAPGGVIGAAPVQTSCPPCVAQATFEPPPVHTVIKEVVQDKELTPPGWWKESNVRFEDILDRELKIAEREREISRREETVNRREHDASRREAWIVEQLA